MLLNFKHAGDFHIYPIGADVYAGVDVGAGADVGAGVGAVGAGTSADAAVVGVMIIYVCV